MKKFIKHLWLATLLFLIATNTNIAQNTSRICGHTSHMEKLLKNPIYAQKHREKLKKVKTITAARQANCDNRTVLPIAVHFQDVNNPDINCLRQLAMRQTEILNEDFQGINSDISKWTNDAAATFPGVNNGEACIEFCLATKNHPNGFGLNDGDLAVTVNQTSGDSDAAWAGYINIFVRPNLRIGFFPVLGFAPLGGEGNGDGITVTAEAFGSGVGCGSVQPNAPFNLGRTVTHEMGHYLLLEHMWGSGNGGCNIDDGVADTPNSEQPYDGCPTIGAASCGSADMHMSYMDYSNDECLYMFSEGQVARMENYLSSNLQDIANNAANKCGTNDNGNTGGSNNNIAEGLILRSNWQDNSLPTTSGLRYNEIWGYTDCAGNEYAILGGARTTHFFNVTNPSNITEVNRFEGTGNSIWRDYKTFRNYAYGVADQGNEGLAIYDLSNLPNSVNSLGLDNAAFSTAHNIFIDEANARLYVAGSNTRSNGLIVFDLSTDPANPQMIGNVNLPGGGYVHDVYVRDNIAYCSHGNNGYYIWNFTNASSPQLMASLATNGYNHSSWLTEDGNYAIVAEEVPDGLPLLVVDIRNKADNDITIVQSFKEPLLAPEHTNNTPHNPFIRGNHLIVSYYEDGVQVFDISNPTNPSRIAYYDTAPDNTTYNGTENNWGVYPYLPSGNIIASDTDNGLFVLSPSNFNPSPIANNAISADDDQDGICADIDCDDNNANIGAGGTPGTACNDNDPTTNDDVYQDDGCTCAGVDICDENGGDSDGDGICDDQDCDNQNPNLPTFPNTPCDDGDPNTVDDVIQSDGCTCRGREQTDTERVESTITVNNQELITFTEGTGCNTIILESGYGEGAASWYNQSIDFYGALIQRAQVITYNRAGYRPSTLNNDPRTLDNHASDLLGVINELAINDKVILIGHSYGGPIIRNFAIKYPDKVKGLVFIDVTHEDLEENQNYTQADEDQLVATSNLGSFFIGPGLTAEAELWLDNLEFARTLPNLPDVPVVATTAGTPAPESVGIDTVAHRSLGDGVTNFTYQFFETSGHFIHRDFPNEIVNLVLPLLGTDADCNESTCEECTDGIDNDGDGLVDSQEVACQNIDCTEPCPSAGTLCDDNNPNTQNDVEDGNCNCSGTPTSNSNRVMAKVFMQGFYLQETDNLSTILNQENIIPLAQPFNAAPWNYAGSETVNTIPNMVVDWILLSMRDANGNILEQKAGFIDQNGQLLDLDGSLGIPVNNANNYFSLRHKSHLAIMSSQPYTGGVYDFTIGVDRAIGIEQQVIQNGKAMMFCGDYDNSGIINNLDFNLWKTNGATINQYLPVDGDGNAIINNLDFNLWKRNGSKIGHPPLQN